MVEEIKQLTVLGSTGSVGCQTLDVVRASSRRLKVRALVAARNIERLEEQAREFCPELVVLEDEQGAQELRMRLRDLPVRVEHGMEGILQAATLPDVNMVVNALGGRIGLEPTLAALHSGKDIALANKETLVAAGELVMATARRLNRMVLPVDSEHSAVFQCLEEDPGSIAQIILTASGGPFLGWTRERLAKVTAAEALRHPNWSMGAKITVDSATMMNKGLEVIEAHHLFDLPYEQIEVVVHPQSIVHSMVEYKDGSVLAQLGQPDMRLPIQYALSYPGRWANSFERLNLRGKTLTFLDPDTETFPALELAYQAGRTGGTLPAVMNAANEVAVAAFLEQKVSYLGMYRVVKRVCAEHRVLEGLDLATILAADLWARERTWELINDGHGYLESE